MAAFLEKKIFLNRNRGFGLVDMLITLGIIIFLLALFWGTYLVQLKKAHDAARRTDIKKIMDAFEAYANDNQGCYPDPEDVSMFAICDSSAFSPWLAEIPCSPSGEPYQVVVFGSPCPDKVEVYTNMEYVHDPNTKKNRCQYEDCGGYNYVVTKGG